MVRKKRRKKRTFKGKPKNYIFWYHTLKHTDNIAEFLERGNQRQKNEIKHTLVYLKKVDKELFEEIKGAEILKEID